MKDIESIETSRAVDAVTPATDRAVDVLQQYRVSRQDEATLVSTLSSGNDDGHHGNLPRVEIAGTEQADSQGKRSNVTDLDRLRVVDPEQPWQYSTRPPYQGSDDNPTIGAERSSREAEVLRRHFDLIPGKKDPNFIDAAALRSYLRTSSAQIEADRFDLNSASKHFNRIKQSSNDEGGREASGISRRDIELYPQQEGSFEYQFMRLAYARRNFTEMAGGGDRITPNSMDSYVQSRTAFGADSNELKVISEIAEVMRSTGGFFFSPSLSFRELNARFKPEGQINGRRSNYWDIQR